MSASKTIYPKGQNFESWIEGWIASKWSLCDQDQLERFRVNARRVVDGGSPSDDWLSAKRQLDYSSNSMDQQFWFLRLCAARIAEGLPLPSPETYPDSPLWRLAYQLKEPLAEDAIHMLGVDYQLPSGFSDEQLAEAFAFARSYHSEVLSSFPRYEGTSSAVLLALCALGDRSVFHASDTGSEIRNGGLFWRRLHNLGGVK